MTTLVLFCTAGTALLTFFVFRPLFVGAGSLFSVDESGPSSLKRLLRKKETVYENMKDLEFEFKMGKLSEEDYQRLREEYSREAFDILARIDQIKPEVLSKTGQPQVVATLKDKKD
ncbi:MAG: hypothetical protein AB1898_08950 [Acidobacteriota bacterium]